MENFLNLGGRCVVDLPSGLGRDIFNQIRNAPPVDYKKMRAESSRLVQEMLKEREREKREKDRERKNA